MGTSIGPHIISDSLVYGFDTGYTGDGYVMRSGNSRFAKGRPGVNYIAYNNAVAQSSYTSYVQTTSGTWPAKHPKAIQAYNALGNGITGYVNTGVTDYTNTYHAHWQYDDVLKKPVTVMDCFDSNWKAKNFSGNMAAWSTYGMTTGSKYVISWLQWTTDITKALHVGVYCRNSSNVNGFHDGLSGGSATSKNTKANTWQRVYHVYTVSSNHDVTIDYDTIYMYGHSLGPNAKGVRVKVADVQIELNTDYPSAFIPLLQNNSGNSSERTATESLTDISKNYSISVANVSFDSNGQPTFDGTDDSIGKTRKQYAITDNWSVELVFKPTDDSDTSWNALFGGYLGGGGYWMFHGSGNLTYYEGYSGSSKITYRSWTKANTFVQDQYHHLTITYTTTGSTTGTYNLYYNGGEKTDSFNWTFTFSHSLDSIWANCGDGGRFGTNDIHVYKEYDRVLTPEEVLQNYKSYKNRFSL